MTWTMRDGPWPSVEVDGQIERAESEWLHTNGAGAFAMSTVALMHTRRHHGLLVAALDPPLDRHVILSHAEAEVEVGGKTWRLATHQFPNVAPTPGYRLLERFDQDPLPRWTCRLGNGVFERELALVRGHNALVLSFLWSGKGAARLALKPLMPMRPMHALTREHGAMVQRAAMRQGEVEIQPVPGLPTVTFRHDGVFLGSPDWWRRFEYLGDREQFSTFSEDMWTPGSFDIELAPDRRVYMIIAVGAPPSGSPQELMEATREYWLAQDPGPEHARTVRALSLAAEAFVVDACERPAVMAGYPYYDLRTRDAVIAVNGVLLAREQIERAKRVVRGLLAQLRGGLLPERIAERDGPRQFPSPDATLWLFELARLFADRLGADDPFVQRELYPALRRVYARVAGRRRRWIWLAPDGLIANGAERHALTWMAAMVDGDPVTPRHGLAVELQALWSKGCETLGVLARAAGDDGLADAAEAAANRARHAFRARFWCRETDYPFDCVSEIGDTEEAWADASLRPNAVLALAVDPSLFERWQIAALLRRARDELLTSAGLRSLAASDPRYRSHYEGRALERDSSFHQGTAWTHLIGAYVRASLHLDADDFEHREELRLVVEQALEHGIAIGQVPQLADGDPPHRPRGSPAQAWAVGELLSALIDLGV